MQVEGISTLVRIDSSFLGCNALTVCRLRSFGGEELENKLLNTRCGNNIRLQRVVDVLFHRLPGKRVQGGGGDPTRFHIQSIDALLGGQLFETTA